MIRVGVAAIDVNLISKISFSSLFLCVGPRPITIFSLNRLPLMVDHLFFPRSKCMNISCSLSKVSGVTHQVTNKLLECTGNDAQQLVMFSVIQLIGNALIKRGW